MPSFRRCDRCGRTLSSRTQETARAFSSQPRRGILVPNGVATPWSSKSLQSKRRPSPGAGQARGRAWLSLDLNALGAPVFVFDLKRFAGFVRGLGLVLGAMWTSEVGDTISRTTSTPPRRAARGVRSGGAHPPPLLTSALHSQQESSEPRAILLLIEVRRTSARGDQIDMNEAELVTRVQQAARRRRTATSKTCELTCLSSRE